MKMKFRKTLIASAVVALTAGTAWAATDTPKYEGDASAKSAIEQPASGDAKMQREPQPVGQATGKLTPRSGKSGPVSGKEIYARSADSLAGAEVVDTNDEKIGEIKQIVLSPDSKSVHAVIAEGGLLGVGARDVRVSLDQLMPVDEDKLQWSVTKKEVEAMEEHEPGRFVEITGSEPISGEITEFSAFEPVGKDDDQPQAAPSMPKPSTDEAADAPMTPKSQK